ncbi:MAG TPA: hypothetical protein VM597_35000 [Gemmataceae bacterium]|nr:hypothetical protein [Gemmataceae bacterium]
MPAEAKACPKCQGQMVRGFLLGGPLIASWFEGEPRKGLLGNIKLPGPPLTSAAYRCVECGYLELYAGQEYDPK